MKNRVVWIKEVEDFSTCLLQLTCSKFFATKFVVLAPPTPSPHTSHVITTLNPTIEYQQYRERPPIVAPHTDAHTIVIRYLLNTKYSSRATRTSGTAAEAKSVAPGLTKPLSSLLLWRTCRTAIPTICHLHSRRATARRRRRKKKTRTIQKAQATMTGGNANTKGGRKNKFHQTCMCSLQCWSTDGPYSRNAFTYTPRLCAPLCDHMWQPS